MKTRLCQKEMLTKETVKKFILTSDDAVKRAALFIYNLQTADEKQEGMSIHENKVGFSAYDSIELSAFAEKCKSNKVHYEEIRKYRPRLLKYSGQIANHVNATKDIQYEWVIK